MPVEPLMTWVPERRGWLKKYRGRMYSVSCRQLGAPATKAGSVLAANNWWEAKLQEVESQERGRQQQTSPVVRALGQWLGRPLTDEADCLTAMMQFTQEHE